MSGPGTNTGHGHVWRRPDGVRMRCGGPGLCSECSADAIRLAPTAAESALPDWWDRIPAWALHVFRVGPDGPALHGKVGIRDAWIGWRPGVPHGLNENTACLHGDFSAQELRGLAALMEPASPVVSSAQPAQSSGECEAAAAMVEAAWSALRDTPGPLTPATVAITLQAGLRALADHQHRTPSALPAASPVAWLRTVASEMARVEPGEGRVVDAAQDGAGSALGGSEAVGSAVGPDGAAAGTGGLPAPPDPRVLAMTRAIADRLRLRPRDFVDTDQFTIAVTGEQLRGLAADVLFYADRISPVRRMVRDLMEAVRDD